MESKLLKDLAAMAALPHVNYVPSKPDVAVASVYLRQTTGLAFFDSRYAATALDLDRKIAYFDRGLRKSARFNAHGTENDLERMKNEDVVSNTNTGVRQVSREG